VTSAGNRPGTPAPAAILAGFAAAFVIAVDAVRWMRIGVLIDPEPSWALPRLLLGLFAVTLSAAAAALAATLVWMGARWLGATAIPAALTFRPASLMLLSALAVAVGTLLRFVDLSRRPSWLFVDDLSLIAPTLALGGSLRDFADSIRPVPFGVQNIYGSVGVLYLEAFRHVLRAFGTTVFSLRFLSALAGSLSLVTAALVGKALLPRGGGALTALVLAGLRWHLILSRWGWVMLLVAPVVDVAALLLLRARRHRSSSLALASGAVAGVGCHIYLAAWVAGAALLGLSLWPAEDVPVPRSDRRRLALLFAVGFAVVVAPLFLLREGRTGTYFARTSDHNVLREIQHSRSALPAVSAAADGLVGPWITGDPSPRNDLPGKSRLGWILGIPVLAALVHTLLAPRRELSGFLLLQAGAALAATVAGGEALNPNGSRFGYLTTVTAVAAAAGILLLIGLVPLAHRRPAAIAALGLVAISGALGARDALIRWPEARETFAGFFGQDTLLGRSMARWASYGSVDLAPHLAHSTIAVEAIRRYGLDPDRSSHEGYLIREGERTFRIVGPKTEPAGADRLVEKISDPWGFPWAVVIGRKNSTP
jgi:hypothetical protein